MRRAVVVPIAALAMVLAPGSATADVVFDQADAEELAATLDEAHAAQNVCYGWNIQVDNVGIVETSTGSNFGAGQSLEDMVGSSDCDARVEFRANITWTSESSESEDSASYSVESRPSASGPTTEDLDSLDIISSDGLAGDNVDVDAYKAVAALPLLAADAGLADPIEASPAPEAEAGDAQPTNKPGSDFWRQSGMLILWGGLLLLAGAVFAWFAMRTSRQAARRATRRASRRGIAPVGPPAEQLPEYVPADWQLPDTTPPAPTEPPSAKPADAEPPSSEPSSQDAPRQEPSGPAAPGSAEPTEPTRPTGPADSGTKPKDEPDRGPDPETRPEG